MSQAGRPLSPDHYTAEEVARLLDLRPLAGEGGFFRRTLESPDASARAGRRAYSAIYTLLTPDGFSALHRLRTDEVWCFHAGDPLESLRLTSAGTGEWVHLGLNPLAGEQPQNLVAKNLWQGTRLRAGGRWALVSCLVVPEFIWDDFELGARAPLLAEFPRWSDAIVALTRLQPPAGER